MVAGMTTLDPGRNGTTFSIMAFHPSNRIQTLRRGGLLRSFARRLLRPVADLYAHQAEDEAAMLRAEVELLEVQLAELATAVERLEDDLPRVAP